MRTKERVERLEQAARCEACEAYARMERRVFELEDSLKPEDERGLLRTYTDRCLWCGRERVEECEATLAANIERALELESRGELCSPEGGRLCEWFAGHVRRLLERESAEVAAKLEAILQDYKNDIAGIKTPRLPYLCRVPQCGCDHPKPTRAA